ncbi:TlpA disulfide reductase family protein [Pseudaeromonas paramecii]|uniref:TlpA disulfide reductase family protein n=1 Tax=Pseudaeromonas paramecii TaxID=2138166 RepID=A0ABP8QCN4_9GAMM
MRPWWLKLAGLCLLLLLSACGEAPRLQEGETAPPLGALTLDDQPVDLAQWRGKYVYLVFWSDSCGGCLQELPGLDALYRQHGDRLVVVGVNTDADVARIRQLQAQLELHFPLVRDQLGISSERYELQGTPSAYLLDPEGRLLRRQVGAQGHHSLATLLQPYLSLPEGTG